MAEQVFKCPTGHDVFYDDDSVNLSINRLSTQDMELPVQEKVIKTVTVYLTCSVCKEVFPVRVKKSYSNPGE